MTNARSMESSSSSSTSLACLTLMLITEAGKNTYNKPENQDVDAIGKPEQQ